MVSNAITLIGNLTRDPELRFTPSGSAVTNFGIAVNRKWQNRQTQEWEEETTFFNVVIWQQQAENAAESLHKGDRVFIAGRLNIRQYDAEDGSKRTSVDVIADEIGPTLRFATAEVQKNERNTSFDGNGRGGESNGKQGQRPSARQQPQRQTVPRVEYYEEEPF